MKKIAFIVFSALLSLCSGKIYSLNNIVIDSEGKTYDLVQNSAYYLDNKDNTDVLKIHELAKSDKFSLVKYVPLQLGYSEKTVWIQFSLEKNIKNDKGSHWIMEFLNPATSCIDIYFVEANGLASHIYSGGMSRDPGENIYHTNYFTNVSDYLGKKGIFYVKLNSIFSHVIDIRLITDSQLATEENKQRLIPGIIAGMLFSLFLYNLFTFLSLKDITYFFYAGYMLFGLFWFGSNVGYTKIIFQSHTQLMIFFIQTMTSIWIIFHLLFVKKFLALSNLQPQINFVFNALIIFYIIIASLNSWIPPAVFYNTLEAAGLVGLFLTIYTGIRSWKNGFTPARFFLAGYFIFFSLYTIYLLIMARAIPVYNFSFFLLIPGIANAGEATMLSFALADRYRLLEKENQAFLEIQRDMNFAVEVQQHLFPEQIPQQKNYHIVGNYIPSTEMCGDFYDILEDHEKKITSVLIADVAGHGYSAALISAMVKIAFRESYFQTKSTSEHITKMNSILTGVVTNTFITASIIQINYETMSAQYSRAGHMPMIRHHKTENSIDLIKPPGIPLGITLDSKWTSVNLTLKKGNRLFLFTDGLVDCLNVSNEEFGQGNLIAAIREASSLSADDFSAHLQSRLKQWDESKLKHSVDDITYIVIDII